MHFDKKGGAGKAIAVVIVIIVIAAGAYYYYANYMNKGGSDNATAGTEDFSDVQANDYYSYVVKTSVLGIQSEFHYNIKILSVDGNKVTFTYASTNEDNVLVDRKDTATQSTAIIRTTEVLEAWMHGDTTGVLTIDDYISMPKVYDTVSSITHNTDTHKCEKVDYNVAALGERQAYKVNETVTDSEGTYNYTLYYGMTGVLYSMSVSASGMASVSIELYNTNMSF